MATAFPQMSQSYGLLSGAAFTLTFSLSGIIAGQLADNLNRAKFLGATCMLASLMTFITGFTNVFWVVVVARMMMGIM